MYILLHIHIYICKIRYKMCKLSPHRLPVYSPTTHRMTGPTEIMKKKSKLIVINISYYIDIVEALAVLSMSIVIKLYWYRLQKWINGH